VLLPQPWGEFGDAGGRVLADAPQDIHQVRIHVDVVQTAGDDKRVGDANVLGPELGPGEIPVLAAHGNDSQLALEMVRVEWEPLGVLSRGKEDLAQVVKPPYVGRTHVLGKGPRPSVPPSLAEANDHTHLG